MKEVKSRVFTGPIGHIKRRVIPTSVSISHSGEPSFFQECDRNEQSHYRAEFKRKSNDNAAERQRPSSPSRRHKPHSVEVYHLHRLQSGLVCNVRSKLPRNSSNNNIFGFPSYSPTEEPASWTKTVYKPIDVRRAFDAADLKEHRFPAIGIVPRCEVTKYTKNDIAKEDPLLPGSYCFSTSLLFLLCLLHPIYNMCLLRTLPVRRAVQYKDWTKGRKVP